jgi:hypothetical protein
MGFGAGNPLAVLRTGSPYLVSAVTMFRGQEMSATLVAGGCCHSTQGMMAIAKSV